MADRSVSVHLRARVAEYQRGLRDASKSTSTLASDLTRLDERGETARRGLTSIGDTAGKMGLLAAGGLAVASKAAIDWETAWAGVTKTVDGSDEQLAQLEEDLREMARTLPASHQEIAAVAEAAGQLGIETESVAEFTETMIALGETTNLTADEAATSIARLTNIMGTSQDDVDRVGSALVDLGNNSATTEAEILTLAQRLAAAGEIAGLSESDVLAFGATLSSVGVEAEAGGTALSKVFTSMRDAVIDGGDELETFAEVAGTTASDFARQFNEAPAEAIDAFIQGLGDMNARGESTSKVFDALSLKDQRLMRALLSTAEAGDLLSDSLERGSQAWEENNALTEEAEKRYGTTESQITVAWNNIKDAAIEAGEVLLPIIAEGAEGVSELAQRFSDLPGPVKNVVTALGGITAVFGGGLWFTSKVVGGIATTKQALSDLGVEAPKTAGGLRRVARTAAGLAAVAVALNAIGEAMPQSGEINSADLARDLEAFADGRASDSIDNLVISLGKLDKQGDNLAEGARNVFTLWGTVGTATWEKAAGEIDKVDQALAGMVESGDEAAAADLFGRIVEAADEAGHDVDEVRGQFDSYRTAVDNAASSSDEAAAGQEELASSLLETAGATEDLTGSTQDYVDAAVAAFGSTTKWRQALKDARKQARESAAGIDGMSGAALDNRRKLEELASSHNDLVRSGEVTEAQMKRMRRQFIDAAGGMGVSKRRARELADELLDLGETDANPKVNVRGAREGISAVRGLSSWLTRLNGKTAKTYVNHYEQTLVLPAKNLGSQLRSNRSGNGALNQADGSVVDFYAGGGIRESHVAQIAPAGAYRVWAEPETGGEAYIPLAMSKRDRSLEIWAETGRRLGAFADGGLVSASAGGGSVFDYERLAKAVVGAAGAGRPVENHNHFPASTEAAAQAAARRFASAMGV